MKEFLVFLVVYLVSAIFNVGWLYLVTKYGLMKWFVRDLFIDRYDGKIVLGVKQMMVAPFFSFLVNVVILLGIMGYLLYYPIEYLIMKPLTSVMKLFSKLFYDNIEENAAKNIFRDKIMGDYR